MALPAALGLPSVEFHGLGSVTRHSPQFEPAACGFRHIRCAPGSRVVSFRPLAWVSHNSRLRGRTIGTKPSPAMRFAHLAAHRHARWDLRTHVMRFAHRVPAETPTWAKRMRSRPHRGQRTPTSPPSAVDVRRPPTRGRGANRGAPGLPPPCTPATAPARRPPNTPRCSRSSPLALAGAGALVGLHTIGDAVAATVRTGICIVGGDVCRTSDAEAAGLEPCTVGERALGSGLTLTIASIRFGSGDEWTAATRSDGSVLVTKSRRRSGGVAAGVGIEASPLGLEFGRQGEARLRDRHRARVGVPGRRRRRALPVPTTTRIGVPPAWRFGEADRGADRLGGREGRRRDAHRGRGDGGGRRGRACWPRPHDVVRPREAGLEGHGVDTRRQPHRARPVDRRRDDGDHERRGRACARSRSAPPSAARGRVR